MGQLQPICKADRSHHSDLSMRSESLAQSRMFELEARDETANIENNAAISAKHRVSS
jgi:hypothetical protein